MPMHAFSDTILLWQICLYVTRWYCIETNAHIVKPFPLSGRDMTLVFYAYQSYKILSGDSSVVALNTRGWKDLPNFALYLGNDTR